MFNLLIRIEDREAVIDVGAEVGVDVVGGVLAGPLAVPGPVGEVADHLPTRSSASRGGLHW